MSVFWLNQSINQAVYKALGAKRLESFNIYMLIDLSEARNIARRLLTLML